MFALEVRGHIMIAHSFRGEVFGPAQKLHGATFVVDACLFAETLDDNGIVADIGRFSDALNAVLAPLNYQNLDTMEQFTGINTTTEVMAKHIFDELADTVRKGGLGREADALSSMRIKLSESHVARAWYEAAV